ncbi:tRNA glutamyl-Q synthetase [Ilyomonas limi]|uniref:tRNA glutamyl-Q synthetase n=1 Tax=Ilyomonas limi TaxID=2575867 RepID=A0A4U3LBA9_9BACT|nr:glutamate--tRNA ligase family protein [Ilyomonas limi]TKK72049.1 tRNA glutamyl-Q synthetase [Ilyomonas limi]
MNAASFYKTRIAPTPSGYLHIGNALSFLITTDLAKKAGAKLLLRIDDLDSARTRQQYVEDIFDTLRFLEIEWEEGPGNYAEYESAWSQVHRLHLYEAALQQLSAAGLVYACACSRTQWQQNAGYTCTCREKHLPLDTPDTSWRLITNDTLLLTVRTLAGEAITTHLPAAMQSFIVRKKDGHPAYQLASLIDDEYFGIDAIVRGQDLWDCTLAQQYLAQVLDKPFFRQVTFYHHPLVMDVSGFRKLSKSAGATSIRHLRSEGKRRKDVLEMMKHWMDKH